MLREPQPSPTQQDDNVILNEPQRRHFEVFLAMLENALEEIEGLASLPLKSSEDSVTVYDPDLPKAFCDQARSVISSVRSRTRSLASVLKIETQHRSRVRTVRALLTAELVRLDDSYARKLRGYGRVNPRVERELDPLLDAIRSELVQLLAAAETQTGDNAGFRRPKRSAE